MNQNTLLVILGNQLFPIEEIKKVGSKKIFMKEDFGLCTDHLHHKLKILFFFYCHARIQRLSSKTWL